MTILSGLTLFILFSTFCSFGGNTINASAIQQTARPTPTRPSKVTYHSVFYSTVPGFFKQSLEETEPTEFDWISEDFGLLLKTPRGDPDWKTFKKKIVELNENAEPNERYKVLFMGRHGQGYHNVAESYYGSAVWDCFWSLLDGNATSRWDDALLTAQGESEARLAAAAWKEQLKKGAPKPDIFYSSPLRRAASTLLLTFSNLLSSPEMSPIFTDGFRETTGAHTCDRRRSKADLAELYPTFTFTSNFPSGDDPLWSPLLRETEFQKQSRFKRALDQIFGLPSGGDGINEIPDGETYISITAHSGLIASGLNVLDHRPFRLPTGAMIPVVVRAEFREEKYAEKPGPSDVVTPCISAP